MKKRKQTSETTYPSLGMKTQCRSHHHTPPVRKVDVHVHLALLQYLDCATVLAATRFLRALVQLPALEVASVRCGLCKTDVALWGWQVLNAYKKRYHHHSSSLRCGVPGN